MTPEDARQRARRDRSNPDRLEIRRRCALAYAAALVKKAEEEREAREGLSWHLRHLLADTAHIPWRIRLIVERSSRSVVGSINLKGPPSRDGDVEIGWGVVGHCRRRGYALEAATAVVGWVLAQPGVNALSATVPSDNVASQRLAAKLGMTLTGDTRRNLPLWKLTNRITTP